MAPTNAEVEKHQAFLSDWMIYDQLAPDFFAVHKSSKDGIRKSVLFVHAFHLFTHRNLSAAQSFLETHPNPDLLTTVADKLRYYRFSNELLQMDVAKILGIDRQTYAYMENSQRTTYDITVLETLAEFYQIPVENLLDDYNLFLRRNPGTLIKSLRKSYHITQRELAAMLNINRNAVCAWENEWHEISSQTFHLLFHTDFIQKHLDSR